MKRRLALAAMLLFILLLSGLGWIGLTESGLRWTFQFIQQQIPGVLRVSALRGSLLGGVDVIDLDYRDDELQVRGALLRIEWLPRHLLTGRLAIERLALGDLRIILPQPAAGAAKPASPALPDIVAPLSIDLRQVEIDGLELRQGERHYRLTRLEAAMQTHARRMAIDRLALESEQFRVSLNGLIDLAGQFQHQLAFEAEATLPSADRVMGKGSLTGDLRHSRVEAELAQPSRIRLSGGVNDVLQALSWQAEVTLNEFESSQWRYPLPELAGDLQFEARGGLRTAMLDGSARIQREDTGVVDSRFRLQWGLSEVLEIQSLQLDWKQSGMRIDAEGSWKPNQTMGQFDLDLAWQNLHWPVRGERWFHSDKGTGHISGQPDGYRFVINSSAPRPEIPDSDWTLDGRGNLRSLAFERILIKREQASVIASGMLDWSRKLSWKFDAEGHSVDPALLDPDWPGRLDFKLSHSGRYDEELVGSVDIDSLTGELRGYPVQLNGAMDIQGETLDIRQAEFRSAGSSLTLAGRVADVVALDWSLRSPNLEQLLPQAQGRLQASGHIAGTREQPLLSATLDGANLAYADYRAEKLQGRVEIDPKHFERLRIDLVASSLQLGLRPLRRLSVKGAADELEIHAVADNLEASARLRGEASAQTWRGHLQQVELNLGPLQQWSQVEPAALAIDAQRVRLERTCLQSDGRARLCVDLRGGSGEWSSNTSLTALPLQRLGPWLPQDIVFDSVIDADGQWRFQQGRLAGRLRAKLPAGALRFPLKDGTVEQLSYRSGFAEAEFTEQGIQSRLGWMLESGGRIDAVMNLPGARLPGLEAERQNIEGRIDLQLEDLSFVGLLLPEIHQFTGHASAGIELSGRMLSPDIDGSLSLDQGGFLLPRLGLAITDLSLTAKSQGLEQMDFRLNASSGQGRVVLDGQLKQDEQGRWFSQMSVNGEDFDVAQIPEAQIQASPELSVRIEPYRIEIAGRVLIPYAHIEPRDFSTAVRVSDDVVIVGQEQDPAPRWTIVSRVEVELGDRVHFFGYGFEGRLGGQVTVEENTGLPTRAAGEIRVRDGRYRAYGQRLDIEQGRLVFSGGPLSEPALDIRSVRVIDDITVGIRATGPINKPQLELFSTPAMGQTDILSYLLLGRPLESASDKDAQAMAKAALALGLAGGDRLVRSLRERFGLDEMRVESSANGDQASLVIGRYLSPRLYVSYGIGLIEAFNTFVVRYQISQRWQLKAQSGEAHSADLIYSIER